MTDYKAIRTELGLTQKDLGELLGIDPTQISKAENGHEVPAMYEYALKGLQAEAGPAPDGEPVDVQPLHDRIAELEAQLVDTNKKLSDANDKLLAAPQATPATPVATEQPKKRRGLGRPKGAQVHGME